MSTVVGVAGGTKQPDSLAPSQIPIEATPDRELRVSDRAALALPEKSYIVQLAILKELMMLNDYMNPKHNFNPDRAAYAELVDSELGG